MSDKEKNAVETGAGTATASKTSEEHYSDEHTTEPNAPSGGRDTDEVVASAKWQMPKPKFQQTSGYLPQGYLQDMHAAAAAAKASSGSEDTTREQEMPFEPAASDAAAAEPIQIEPQPDISEQIVLDEPLSETPQHRVDQKGRSGTAFVVLGVFGILFFLAVFMAVVYFLFLAEASDTTNF